MKAKIRFQGKYALITKGGRSETTQDWSFERALSNRRVHLVVSYQRASVTAVIEDIEVDEVILAEVTALGRFDGEQLSPVAEGLFTSVTRDAHLAVRQLLGVLKYHLRHFYIAEQGFSVTSEEWSRADSIEVVLPVPSTLSMSVDNLSSWPLDATRRGWVQASLDAGILPLIAMRHLHRAKHESASHHKWIDATTAAELAVKEVLCRVRPELETLVLEMPSPPFAKMYGPIAKAYLGEESPFRKQLVEGQERRNRLVHRPGSESIDGQQAINYVTVVEAAIFHLLHIAYPHDMLIADAYDTLRGNVPGLSENLQLRRGRDNPDAASSAKNKLGPD